MAAPRGPVTARRRHRAHLLVISYCEALDSDFEAVALAVDPRRPGHFFARCQRPTQLYPVVSELGLRLTTLDLYGHGAPGALHLGDELLVDHRGRGLELLSTLAPLLAPRARLRLLGCRTGVGREGRRLLRATSRALPGRTVLAMTSDLYARDFGPAGLSPNVGREFLVSSDGLARSARLRARHGPWAVTQRKPWP